MIMAVLSSDYNGCAVMLYDASGNCQVSTIVTNYDKKSLRLEVRDIPQALKTGDNCRLLILTSPSPCEYQGRVIKDGQHRIIAMYMGKEYENREDVRYNINSPAFIDNMICDGKAYQLHTPYKIKLINISKSGARFSAPNNTLFDGDIFQMRMKISRCNKILIAEIANHLDRNDEISEYGCRLLVSSEKVV